MFTASMALTDVIMLIEVSWGTHLWHIWLGKLGDCASAMRSIRSSISLIVWLWRESPSSCPASKSSPYRTLNPCHSISRHIPRIHHSNGEADPISTGLGFVFGFILGVAFKLALVCFSCPGARGPGVGGERDKIVSVEVNLRLGGGARGLLISSHNKRKQT
jgi:hypothetical protein